MKQPATRVKAVINSCVLFLSALLLVAQQSSAFADEQAQQASVFPAQLTAYFTNGDHSHRVPFTAAASPEQQGLPCESDVEEDFDHDWNPLAEHQAFKNTDSDLFPGSSVQQRFCSINNRASVPYFILYHSWKSFLG